ncbi:MAG: TRAP transporter small permease [Spirochaetia bacterium]|nr:TRAP transporter small permease [Spirochaetia bacterium]MDI9427179.1 TRAP transporter small permease [Spirochaetota bacterium]NLH90152.1 TRAP transporter small permease [Treponema sp.]
MKEQSLFMKTVGKLESAVRWIVVVLLIIMVVDIITAVFFRYVLQNSIFWAEELSRYLMIWAGMLGAGLAMKDDAHIGIDFVVRALPNSIQFIAKVIAKLVVEIFLIVVFIESIDYLKTLSIQRSAALEIPMALPYLSVTAGMVFMAIENILGIIRLLDDENQRRQEINK